MLTGSATTETSASFPTLVPDPFPHRLLHATLACVKGEPTIEIFVSLAAQAIYARHGVGEGNPAGLQRTNRLRDLCKVTPARVMSHPLTARGRTFWLRAREKSEKRTGPGSPLPRNLVTRHSKVMWARRCGRSISRPSTNRFPTNSSTFSASSPESRPCG